MTLADAVAAAEAPANELERLKSAIADIGDTLRTAGAAGEANRDVMADALALLRDRGFFRLWLPQVLGGIELAPVAALEVFQALAKLDSSLAWVVSNSSVITTFLQAFPEAGLREVYANADNMVAGAWFPPGAAQPIDGGYVVSGQWSFASGCRHADWFTGLAAVVDDSGEPSIGPGGGPRLLLFLVPAPAIEVVEHWDTLGMRGTGSHDVRIEQVTVPARFVFELGPFAPTMAAFLGPLYKFHMWLGGPVIAATALGVAEAALEQFMSTAETSVPSYTTVSLAQRPNIRDTVARVAAKIGAGSAYLHQTVDAAYHAFRCGAVFEPRALVPVQLAASGAVEAAMSAVDLLHGVAGTRGIRAEAGLERHFRDVHTIAQHTLASAARFESVGQLMFDQPCDWLFFGL